MVGIGILVGVAAFVARPLFERSSEAKEERGATFATRAQLTARRDAVYALIHELDADHQTGKVNAQDYGAQRARYVAEGVSILKELDALPDEDSRAALESEIEAQVLALRQAGAAASDNGQEPVTRFCTQCGQAAGPEHLFCARCGAPLKGVAAQ